MELIANKYKKWYFNIVESAKYRKYAKGYERHHVLPKSLGGNNQRTNLVYLTPREHFICHLLLVKVTTGKNKQLMQYAVGKFIQCNKSQNRRFTSWEYQAIKKSISDARTGSKHSIKTLQKMSESKKGLVPWNKGLTGLTHSEESNIKRSKTLKGKTLEEKVGKERADNIKKQISKTKTGKPSGMLGKTHPRKGTSGLWHMTDEGKNNVSKARKGIQFSEEHIQNLILANRLSGEKRKGIKQTILQCPHCGKTGGISGLKRYHLDNCRHKQ